jgi:hypothetical protein
MHPGTLVELKIPCSSVLRDPSAVLDGRPKIVDVAVR